MFDSSNRPIALHSYNLTAVVWSMAMRWKSWSYLRSFVFFNSLFYKVLISSLAVSVAAKAVVNFVKEPVGQNDPFPSGRFDITHFQHFGEFPDYSSGMIGKITFNLGGFIERLLPFDNVGMVLFIGVYVFLVMYVSFSTFGKNRSGLVPIYVGLGLIFAGGISNKGELALFGHVTDFLFIRITMFSDDGFIVPNFADFMILIGFILILVTPTYQKAVAAFEAAKASASPLQ